MADALKDMIAEVQAEIDSGAAADDPPTNGAKAATEAVEAEPEPEAAAGEGATEAVAAAEGAADAEGEAGEPEGRPDPKERQQAARNKGMQKRIDQLTAQKTAAERRIEEAEARAAAAEARAAAAEARRTAEEDPPAEGETQPQRRTGKTEAEIRAEVEAEVERKFRQKAEAEARAKQEQEFAERSNAAYEAGVKQFGKDFEPAVETLNAIGLNAETLGIALATDAPAKVLFQLGNDPDEAERIFALSPVKMAMEMAKIASSRPRQVAGKPVSQAPDPIRPVGGRGAESDDLTAEASDAAVDKYLKGFNERYARKWG